MAPKNCFYCKLDLSQYTRHTFASALQKCSFYLTRFFCRIQSTRENIRFGGDHALGVMFILNSECGIYGDVPNL